MMVKKEKVTGEFGLRGIAFISLGMTIAIRPSRYCTVVNARSERSSPQTTRLISAPSQGVKRYQGWKWSDF
jgi:hypothetical protein